MTNFDRFLTDPQFTSFAEVAVSAEKIYPIDPAACVLNCRRSMEFAVKWMYSVDNELVMPYDDRLVSLMDAEDFRDIVGEDLWRRLKYIRQTGNAAAHTGKTELANSVNRMRLNSGSDYYNSGVLLMDLAAARREIDPEEIFRYVAEHKKELLLPDQDLLNALYGRRILPLDDALWNYDARNYNNYLLRSGGEQDTDWVMAHTAILHFCGKAKPWKPGYVYRFGVLYHHYAQLTRRACRAAGI